MESKTVMDGEEKIRPRKKLDIKVWAQKAGEFFHRNYALFFAPVFVLFLYMVTLAIYGIYPFGKEYTVASYDLSAQICPFIEHIFDVFEGKSTLTFSYAIMGGADVTGTFLYFFISPFSWLFLICGDGMVLQASSIVMACKLMAISVSGTWFAKKLFKGIPDYLCIAVGVVYTYCGYMFVSNTYINWMDFLIYMPFCAWAFVRYVKTGSFLPFSIMLACCIYTCFSIACFSMFTVFPVLVGYAFLCVKKEEKKRFIAYLCISFAVAILIALPILLPALSAFLNSARGGSLFENLWYGFTVAEETGIPQDFNSSNFIASYSQSLYRKWSYIVCDSIFVILTLIWFVRKGLKDPFAKFMLLAGVMTLLPLLVDEAMLLMNMGSYMSYALRFGFLNALYFLGGACLCLEGLCYEKGAAYDGAGLLLPKKQTAWLTEKQFSDGEKILPAEENEGGMYEVNAEHPLTSPHNRRVRICTGCLLVLGALAAAFLIWFSTNGAYKTFWGWFIDDEEVINTLGGFAGRFAHSLGGIEVLIIPFVAVVIVSMVGCLFVALKKSSPRTLALVLLVVVGVQVVFYNNQLVLGNRSTTHVKVGQYQSLCAELNERDESYFRVKDYSDDLTACVPFSGETNSFSVFSSVIDADNFTTLQLFGYLGNGKNTFKSAHNSGKNNRCEEFGDAFMGYKYFFVPKDERSLVESKPYMKKVLTRNENGTQVHLHDGDYYIYENTIVFPSAYRVDSGEFRFVRENTNNSVNRKYNQAALYEFLRGKTLQEMQGVTGSAKSDAVTVETATELSEYLWGKAADIEVGAGRITAKVTAKAGENLLLNFVAVDGYTVTVNGKKAELVENDLKFLSVALEEGENEVVFTYASPYVKYAFLGLGGALAVLCAVAFVLKKTKIVEKCTSVIAWAGVLFAMALTAFFFIFPSCVFITKIVALLL